MSFWYCCCTQPPPGGCAKITIKAFGCNGGVSPQTLTITVTGNGNTYTGASTPFTTPALPNGTYTWSVTSPRFNTQSGTVTITCPQADVTVQVNLVAASGYVCLQGCDTPWNRTLNLTDSYYSVATTVTYNDATFRYEGTGGPVNVVACGLTGGVYSCQAHTVSIDYSGVPGAMGGAASPALDCQGSTITGPGSVSCPPNGIATNTVQDNLYRSDSPNNTTPPSSTCIQGTSTITIMESAGGNTPMVVESPAPVLVASSPTPAITPEQAAVLRADVQRRASIRRRANLCPHREAVGDCRCNGYCALGRGFRAAIDKTGQTRSLASLDDCGNCPDLPHE